jgi:hypothetical protein
MSNMRSLNVPHFWPLSEFAILFKKIQKNNDYVGCHDKHDASNVNLGSVLAKLRKLHLETMIGNVGRGCCMHAFLVKQ